MITEAELKVLNMFREYTVGDALSLLGSFLGDERARELVEIFTGMEDRKLGDLKALDLAPLLVKHRHTLFPNQSGSDKHQEKEFYIRCPECGHVHARVINRQEFDSVA